MINRALFAAFFQNSFGEGLEKKLPQLYKPQSKSHRDQKDASVW